MKETLAKIYLFSWIPFLLGIATDGGYYIDWYFIAGALWTVTGTWLSIVVLNDKK